MTAAKEEPVASGWTVNIGRRGKKRFRDENEVRQWIAAERQAWEWVRGQGLTAGQRAISQLHAVLNGIEQSLSSNDSLALEQAFADKRLIAHDSPLGQALLDLKDRDSQAAMTAFSILVGIDWHVQELQRAAVLRGVGEAALLSHGLGQSALAGLARSQKGTIEDMTATLADLEAKRLKLEEELQDLRSTRDKERQENKEATASAIDEFRSEYTKALSATREEFSALKTLYEEEMKVKAPVNFWEDRRKLHGQRATLFGVAFSVLLILAVACVFGGTAALFPGLWHLVGIDIPGAQGGTNVAREPRFESVAVLALLVTPILWGIRMVARNLVSHSHLAADAAERVTMTQTYLAFLKDQRVTEEERKLLLQALFRPGATGLVKEELPTTGIWEFLRPPR